MGETRHESMEDALHADRAASGGSRLRDKYEFLKSMRSNETQEALARECQLSFIIMELKKRVKDMEASRECEREAHMRESFYLIKENESAKEQVRTLEKMLAIDRSGYVAEVSKLRARVCDVERLLVDERLRSMERESEQDRVAQHLCNSLYKTQGELERYDEQNKGLVAVQQKLWEMSVQCKRLERECSMWEELQEWREALLLLERDAFVELQCSPMRERLDGWRHHGDDHCRRLEAEASRVVRCMQDGVEMYKEVKRLLLEDAVASTEKEVLLTHHRSTLLEMSQLSENCGVLELRLDRCMRGCERNKNEYLEQVAWLKALDDVTLGYVLRQRDEEVADKLRTWKDALLEAHKLLRALLKRYEPFQKGDDAFVAVVIECLASAPHVKDPVNMMDSAFRKEAISELIRVKSAELGGVETALRFVHKYIREAVQSGGGHVPLHNIFPPKKLGSVTGKLCRCRGMIQEMEPNMSFYRASCTDFFGTVAADGTTMLEATLLYVIPVPGNAHFYGVAPLHREEGGAAGAMNVGSAMNGCAVTRDASSTCHVSMDHLVQEWPQGQQHDDVSTEREMKRLRQEKVVPQCHNASQLVFNAPLYQQLNLPHPPLSRELHTACIVTVIQHSSVDKEERLQLNDVVDFFGFLEEYSPPIDVHNAAVELDAFESFDAWHTEEFPSEVVSRMTCISWQHVYTAPEHPLLPLYFEGKRPLVLQYLTSTICQGDALVAEYLLLHLCARVIAHESITPVGDIPLRVEGDAIDPEVWSVYMRDVVPVGEVLLDASQLSNTAIPITPRQDPKTNVLRTGVLQLANGTHVTLDCRSVSATNESLYNALFVAMHKQMLLLEYPYQVQEIPIDVGFLALATKEEENVDFLRLAVSVRWLPELPLEAVSPAKRSTDEVREYLSHVRCLRRGFDKNASDALRLSDRLMDFCKIERGWSNHDSFIHNNSFAMAAALMRASAASFGREVITDEDVERIFSLERQRVARNS